MSYGTNNSDVSTMVIWPILVNIKRTKTRQRCMLEMKKVLRGDANAALAVVRRSHKFSPRRRPPTPGARDGQHLISWIWSLPLRTNPVWWGSMHTISSYRGNRPTNKQTQPQTHTHTGPITIHCAAASAQCSKQGELLHRKNWLRLMTTTLPCVSKLHPFE